jgi:lipoprotein
MKKLLLGIAILGLLGSCARWEDSQKDYESDTKAQKV